MKEILVNKLHQYIRENNPHVLFQLEEDGVVTEYLTNKIATVDILLKQSDKGQPAYIIEDGILSARIKRLLPVRWNKAGSFARVAFVYWLCVPCKCA